MGATVSPTNQVLAGSHRLGRCSDAIPDLADAEGNYQNKGQTMSIPASIDQSTKGHGGGVSSTLIFRTESAICLLWRVEHHLLIWKKK